ncbi:HIR complex [Salix suchowensis]|nr:HIR complex [Salix suchowensis]
MVRLRTSTCASGQGYESVLCSRSARWISTCLFRNWSKVRNHCGKGNDALTYSVQADARYDPGCPLLQVGCEQICAPRSHYYRKSLRLVGCHRRIRVYTNFNLSRNIKKQSAFFPPVSVRPLLASPNNTITAAIVRSNGAPIIICSSAVYTYDSSLLTWVILGDRWWSEGSDAWQGRQRVNASSGSRGILSTIESTIGGGDEAAAEVPRPQWWSTALTLGHMETRLHAARLLDSQPEYKQSLLVYAKKIADEGFRGKAEELVKELFGPIFWRPGRDDSWTPTILGMAKRDLLKDVLSIFARSKTLTKLALDWQDTLKKAANEEQP